MQEQKVLYIIQIWWPNAEEWRDDVAAYPAEELAAAIVMIEGLVNKEEVTE
jgi:hypothetical protein